jgi:hypothetical protein
MTGRTLAAGIAAIALSAVLLVLVLQCHLARGQDRPEFYPNRPTTAPAILPGMRPNGPAATDTRPRSQNARARLLERNRGNVTRETVRP